VLLFGGPDLPMAVQESAARELAALTDALFVAGAADFGVGQRLAAPAAPAPALQPLVDVAACYLLVDAIALARGRSPDHPPHLRKVTETR
jgi:glutamine---fructose-6-phosphate transaminase (isomerizing)